MSKKISRKVTRKTSRKLELPAADAHARAVKAMAPYLADFQRAANEQTAADLGIDAVMDTQQGQNELRHAVKRRVIKKARANATKRKRR